MFRKIPKNDPEPLIDGISQNSENTAKLTDRVDRLSLMCQAMWELLRDHADIDDNILQAKVAEVETRDGQADGKIGMTTFPCPKCGATCNSKRQNCVMCGTEINSYKTHIFE